MAAVLTEEEKVRIRYHLGYLTVDPVSSIVLGIPAATQPMFLVEGAMNRIPDAAVGNIRRLVVILDNIETRMVDAQDRLAAKKVGNIEMNEHEPAMLDSEYRKWAQRLGDLLGVPLNPYSAKFRAMGSSLNVPVCH